MVCEVENCEYPATTCQCGAAHCEQHPHVSNDTQERLDYDPPDWDAVHDGTATEADWARWAEQ